MVVGWGAVWTYCVGSVEETITMQQHSHTIGNDLFWGFLRESEFRFTGDHSENFVAEI
jgi:hypothetical protein